MFYREAALLDEWRLEEWLTLLTEDASYYVPPNDKPDADHRTTLFTIADDSARLKERVKRVMDPNCHAEHPHSRTRRMIGNVRITGSDGDAITRRRQLHHPPLPSRRGPRVFVGQYRYQACGAKTARSRSPSGAPSSMPRSWASLGSVSFIL